MERLRQLVGNIANQLKGLSPVATMLIVSLAVIAGLMLFLVNLYASKPKLEALWPGASVEEQTQIANALSQQGITFEMGERGIMVPAESKQTIAAKLFQNGQMPGRSEGFLRTVLQGQSWANTRQQNDLNYNAALMQYLSGLVATFEGVKSAQVIIDAPEATGLGAGVKSPTASVVVTTKGAPLDQKVVDAIASTVGGSKAGLTPDRVKVVDQFGVRKVRNEADAIASNYLEHAARVEHETRDKLQELLAYIPGVIVSVSAQVDVTRVATKTQKNLPKDDGTIALPHKIMKKENNSAASSRGAEPGVRSNQAADISRAASAEGTKTEDNTTEQEFDNHVGSELKSVEDPRGMPTMIAVSVNVPSGYVASLLKKADAKKEPTDQEIQAKFDADLKPRIAASILPHVRTMTQVNGGKVDDTTLASQIVVNMVPADMTIVATPAAPGLVGSLLATTPSGGGGFGIGGPLVDKVILGVLGLFALGFMFTMTRKVGKRVELPTAEELVGLPPALEKPTDLIGEAEEGDAPLAGIEVEEGDVRAVKVLEQVNDMVTKDPEAAAKMIRRWMAAEE